jgi:hypothetical protein
VGNSSAPAQNKQ